MQRPWFVTKRKIEEFGFVCFHILIVTFFLLKFIFGLLSISTRLETRFPYVFPPIQTIQNSLHDSKLFSCLSFDFGQTKNVLLPNSIVQALHVRWWELDNFKTKIYLLLQFLEYTSVQMQFYNFSHIFIFTHCWMYFFSYLQTCLLRRNISIANNVYPTNT